MTLLPLKRGTMCKIHKVLVSKTKKHRVLLERKETMTEAKDVGVAPKQHVWLALRFP